MSAPSPLNHLTTEELLYGVIPVRCSWCAKRESCEYVKSSDILHLCEKFKREPRRKHEGRLDRDDCTA